MRNFFLSIKEKIWLILAVFFLAALIFSSIYSFFNPLFFQAKVRVLIVQHLRPDFDALTTLQAQERLAKNFQVFIESQNFMDKVLRANTNIWDSFGNEDNDRIKKWQKAIKGKATREGILEIKARSVDPDQAWQIASAITFVLFQNGKDYHGGGDLVTFRLLDPPRVSDAFWLTLSMYFPRILGLAFLAWLLIYIVSYPWKPKHFLHAPDMKMEEKKEAEKPAEIKPEAPLVLPSKEEPKIFTPKEPEAHIKQPPMEELKQEKTKAIKKENNLQEPKFWLDQFLQEQQKEEMSAKAAQESRSNKINEDTQLEKNHQPRAHLRAGAEILYERPDKIDLYDIAEGNGDFASP